MLRECDLICNKGPFLANICDCDLIYEKEPLLKHLKTVLYTYIVAIYAQVFMVTLCTQKRIRSGHIYRHTHTHTHTHIYT